MNPDARVLRMLIVPTSSRPEMAAKDYQPLLQDVADVLKKHGFVNLNGFLDVPPKTDEQKIS